MGTARFAPPKNDIHWRKGDPPGPAARPNGMPCCALLRLLVASTSEVADKKLLRVVQKQGVKRLQHRALQLPVLQLRMALCPVQVRVLNQACGLFSENECRHVTRSTARKSCWECWPQ